MLSLLLISTLALLCVLETRSFSITNLAERWNQRYQIRQLFMSSNEGSGQVIKYGGIQHCGVLVSDVDKSKKFYMTVFGFSDDSFLRPATLPYPGAFLRVGNDQIHLMGLPNPDPTSGRPDHGGRDRHIAFTVNNIDTIVGKLKEKDIKYTLSMSGRRALFCRDPDGNAFEFVEDVSLH